MAEAMACGCIVIGYPAGGGRGFPKPEFSFPVEYGNVLGFARAVEEVIRAYETGSARFTEMARAASEFVAKHYSPQREEEEIFRFWKKLVYPIDSSESSNLKHRRH